MVQIIGPDSLLNRVKMEFHLGNPDKIDYSIENIDHFLEDLAVGQPEGTYENLKMLFGIGVMVENLIETTGVKSIKRVYMSNELVPNAFTMRILPIPKIECSTISPTLKSSKVVTVLVTSTFVFLCLDPVTTLRVNAD